MQLSHPLGPNDSTGTVVLWSVLVDDFGNESSITASNEEHYYFFMYNVSRETLHHLYRSKGE